MARSKQKQTKQVTLAEDYEEFHKVLSAKRWA